MTLLNKHFLVFLLCLRSLTSYDYQKKWTNFLADIHLRCTICIVASDLKITVAVASVSQVGTKALPSFGVLFFFFSSSSLWSSSLPFLYLSRLLVFQAGASSTVAVVAFLVPSSSAHWHVQALPLFRHEMAITACLDANCFYLCTLCTLSACLHCLCLPQCLCLCVCAKDEDENESVDEWTPEWKQTPSSLPFSPSLRGKVIGSILLIIAFSLPSLFFFLFTIFDSPFLISPEWCSRCSGHLHNASHFATSWWEKLCSSNDIVSHTFHSILST